MSLSHLRTRVSRVSKNPEDIVNAHLAPAATAELLDPLSKDCPDDLPCRVHDPDLWFADRPADMERAKALCQDCPAMRACLAGALSRGEQWGVWGGQIIERGVIIAHKRPRGRPRKHDRIGVAA